MAYSSLWQGRMTIVIVELWLKDEGVAIKIQELAQSSGVDLASLSCHPWVLHVENFHA